VSWGKVWSGSAGESETVEEEESENDNDTGQYAPPELFVHGGLDMLLTLHQILHSKVEGIQRPDVESCQCGGEGENHEQDQWACIVRADSERGDSVDNTEDKMRNSKPANDGHGLAQRRLDNTIAHTHDEEQEERERVAERIQDGDNYHEYLCANVVAMAILVVVESPSHEHLNDQEDEDGGDVILNSQDIVSVLEVEKAPKYEDDKVDDGDAAVKGQLGDLSSRQLSISVAECDDGLVFDVLRVRRRGDAVIAGLERNLLVRVGEGVVDRLGLVEVDGGGADEHVGGRVCAVGDEPLTLMGVGTELRIDCVVVADILALSTVSLLLSCAGVGSSHRRRASQKACLAASSPSTPR
jgi:hypothetical protein